MKARCGILLFRQLKDLSRKLHPLNVGHRISSQSFLNADNMSRSLRPTDPDVKSNKHIQCRVPEALVTYNGTEHALLQVVAPQRAPSANPSLPGSSVSQMPFPLLSKAHHIRRTSNEAQLPSSTSVGIVVARIWVETTYVCRLVASAHAANVQCQTRSIVRFRIGVVIASIRVQTPGRWSSRT